MDLALRDLHYQQFIPMKLLLCIYTCEADRNHMIALESSALMQQVRADCRFTILEIHADPFIALPIRSDKRLILPCRESYSSLSEKTYQMILACMDIEFDFLFKLDSTIVNYHLKRQNKSADLLGLLTPEGVLALIQNPSFYNKPYNGIISQHASEEGFETWMRTKDIACSYRKVFPNGINTPPYYIGKFYALRRDFCEFIAREGANMALEHSLYLGGSEDIMIGRLYQSWKSSQDYI